MNVFGFFVADTVVAFTGGLVVGWLVLPVPGLIKKLWAKITGAHTVVVTVTKPVAVVPVVAPVVLPAPTATVAVVAPASVTPTKAS